MTRITVDDARELWLNASDEELKGLAQEVYVEVPVDEAFEPRLAAVAELGLRGKVRCGGAVVQRDTEIAGLVDGCRERGGAGRRGWGAGGGGLGSRSGGGGGGGGQVAGGWARRSPRFSADPR